MIARYSCQGGLQIGDVPIDTHVYLERPAVVYPLTKWGKPSKNPTIEGTLYEVGALRGVEAANDPFTS